MMFDPTTVSRLSDDQLARDQDCIQDDLEVATDPEHELYDPAFAETLRAALELCNAELRARGMLIDSADLVKP